MNLTTPLPGTAYGLRFEPTSHVYTLNGEIVPSVTQILKNLKPEFDSETIATRCARRDGTTKELVLAAWKEKSDIALKNGSHLHACIEALLKQEPSPANPPPEFTAWLKFWIAASKSLTPVRIEHRVASSYYKIAGTIDALFHSKKSNQLHILDWKTGKFLTDNPYNQFLNKPFDDLPNNQLSIYSLQVSLYRLMLAEHKIQTGDAYLIHCSTPTQKHRALDLRARLHQWLTT